MNDLIQKVRLGLSKERTRQSEAAALGKMRQYLEREGPEAIGVRHETI